MHPRVRWLLPALPALSAFATAAHAFCGLYVAGGESKLFNHKSQVVLVRDADRTVLTLASDYQGDPQEFALVVPVPVVLQRGQIHVGDSALVARLDQYSAPRLVEYYDPDPCAVAQEMHFRGGRGAGMTLQSMAVAQLDDAIAARVHIEAQYQVDEYDIVILSADDSGSLLNWLNAHHYRVPMQAARVVDSYLQQGMKFFVAKVDLRRRAARGITQLRPLQIAYESPKFMLPVRLGMANADGPQELFVYAITRQGRVEPVNYRSVRLPESVEVPEFVKGDFNRTWLAAFDQLVKQNGMGVVFTEYAWNLQWCDPCPAPPLTREEQRALGVWWIVDEPSAPVFVTRLHARYDRASFPEDLVLQVTSDTRNFQSRLVVRHEWQGAVACENGSRYHEAMPAHREQQAKDLAGLTGWSLADIRARMNVDLAWHHPGEDFTPYKAAAWWESIWRR